MTAEKKDFDVAVVSDEPDVVSRVTSICEEFGFSLMIWKTFEEFLDGTHSNYKLVVASLKDFAKAEDAAELAQGIRHIIQEHSFVICCVPKTVDKDAALFAKKSGANLVLVRDEILTTSKVEFAALQTIHSSFLPVKASDLVPDEQLSFTLFHLLAHRAKFIKISRPGDRLSAKKIASVSGVGEIYIHRSDAKAFSDFVNAHNDRSAAGLMRRCRAQFLSLHASFLNLILLLTDQSEAGSFTEGQRLLKVCRDMCDEMLGLLGERGDAWEVINNSAIGELGSVERGPALAAYAGLFGLQMELDSIGDIMLAALLCDLGSILLPPAVAKKIRDDKLGELSADEKAKYRSYPTLSLELALNRKLSLDERFRSIMVGTHERADGSGFPKGFGADKMLIGSQLIQFCRDLDRRTVLRLGRPRANRDVVLRQMFNEDSNVYARYNSDFWSKMRKIREW